MGLGILSEQEVAIVLEDVGIKRYVEIINIIVIDLGELFGSLLFFLKIFENDFIE